MSLKSKFKTDTQAANEGVWFEYPEAANDDGTVPAFRVARKSSSQNKAYALAMREYTKELTSADGVATLADVDSEDEKAADLGVFVDSLLTDWRNFQPEDDGKVLDYDKAAARGVFGNPDWSDLYADLVRKSGMSTAFKRKQLDAEVKK